MKEIGLYIHIPFCKRKCLYCDFNSYEAQKHDEDEYINALLHEMRNYLKQEQFIFKTVFIGGVLPPLLNLRI